MDMDKPACPKGQPECFHMEGWKYPVHLNTMIGWTIGGKVHWKSSAREVIYLSPISAYVT